jgi:hypothetical protein
MDKRECLAGLQEITDAIVRVSVELEGLVYDDMLVWLRLEVQEDLGCVGWLLEGAHNVAVRFRSQAEMLLLMDREGLEGIERAVLDELGDNDR